MKFKKQLRQTVIAIIAVGGLVISSIAFAKTINFSGTLDMNGNGIIGVGAEKAIEFDGGDAYITNHDGYGNFNILSGVDHDNTLVAGDGGTRLELSHGGSLDVEILSGTNGNSGSVAASYNFGGSSLNIGGNNFSNIATMDADTYTTAGCDLAEYYKLKNPDSDIEKGEIVSISPNSRGVERSGKAYDPLALGVISTEPAMTIGETKEVKDDRGAHRPIALAGRVPVKVTTENGPIEKGDNIAPSSKPGYGMKCNDFKRCSGSVIGKAMESLKTGEGKINVLVKRGF